MKTMKSKQFLFLAALGCMAAPVAAQTVDVTLQCGQSYTINSTVNASAAATYQWLENGSTVTGAAATYTVPKTKSVGVYTYIRQARTTDCTDWQSSNAFTVEVKNKDGIDGVCLGGLMWAKYNVDEFGKFASAPEAPGKLYRFNDTTAFPASGTSDWPTYTADTTSIWLSANDPCPSGWHLPTLNDLATLSNAAGGTYSEATINNTACYLVQPASHNASGTSDGSMMLILPAQKTRLGATTWHATVAYNSVSTTGSTYWIIYFQPAGLGIMNGGKSHPRPLRCVAD
jgi:uncharacterized protein (TIGR02145 family)